MDILPTLRDNNLQLRPMWLPEDVAIAAAWYQDPEVLYYSEGIGTPPYDMNTVAAMYRYLIGHGDGYIIEVDTGEGWRPVG